MILWIMFAGFFIALAIILWPLLRYSSRAEQHAPRAENINVYKAQLRELETDQKNGLLSDTEAAPARLEIERRILRMAAENPEAAPPQTVSTHFLMMSSVVILLACAAFYLFRGMPALGGFPLKQQQTSVETLPEIGKLRQYLRENPDDSTGWQNLGYYFSQQSNRAGAASAFQHWYELRPDDIDAAVTYGESLVMLAGGRVGPAASLVFRRAQHIQPRNPAVRHYLALQQYQAGNIERALAEWQALAVQSRPDAPWMGQLKLWIKRAKGDLGIKSTADSISDMSTAEQSAMIKSMVARLQGKMDRNPENIEGWLRLAKAYMVLGEREKAAAALEQAEKYAPDDQKEAIKKQLEILLK